MRIHWLAAAALCVPCTTFALLGCRNRELERARTFEVHDAWVRADPDSGTTTAAYLRFVNGTDDSVVVSRFASDDARAVELHRSWTDSTGIMHMSLVNAAHLAPHGTLVMQPGGYHLMLIGTTHSLRAGQRVRITMRLSSGAIVSTMARVR